MRLFPLAALALTLTACGGFPDSADSADPVDPPTGTDSGSDAGTDSGSDAGTDSGTDAGTDSGTTAGPLWIALNELMADNDTVVADPVGEFDDWVELYNPTGSSVDLTDYGLTDDVGAATPWRFPAGTVIAAGGYLIVWCDSGAGQPGLHADFQLSKAGETLTLVDPLDVVVDEVSFPNQGLDQAWGRYPDGSETWGPVLPTPSAANAPI